ncbi:MAG: FadR family transcriptional regulator [Alphaproteobacteria bacterium]|nr:FadR family transcriptional regulator [Alphaproteobacteria bacterium]
MTVPLSLPADKTAILQPIPPTRNLTQALIERLAAGIRDGSLAPGARLPTEHAMVAAFGVSRTVVREAVAALRAEGLVVTRQGVGAFVAADRQSRPFQIDEEGLRSIGDALNVLEIRTAVESEAAGLAAERASEEKLAAVDRALAALEAAIERGETAVEEDFAFHLSIAEATGNPQFLRLLEFLGQFIIPRQRLRQSMVWLGDQRIYLQTIQREHRDIHAAIRKRNPDAARAAMRRHLVNARKRYQRLAAEAPTA